MRHLAPLVGLMFLASCSTQRAPERAAAASPPPLASTAPADAGPGAAFAERLSCLRSADVAELRISFGTRGCFGGTDNELGFTRSDGGTTVEGSAWASLDSRARLPQAEVPRARMDDFVEAARAALARPEVTAACLSTLKQFAHVEARCDGRTFSETFRAASCGDLPDLPVVGEYLHAVELTRLAQGLLDAFPRHHSPVTAAEVEADHQRWRGVNEDGRRVRHDPIEAWERDGGSQRGR